MTVLPSACCPFAKDSQCSVSFETKVCGRWHPPVWTSVHPVPLFIFCRDTSAMRLVTILT